MKKYITKQAACGRTISTLGGDYALKWDDETQMSVNAHAALLSQFNPPTLADGLMPH